MATKKKAADKKPAGKKKAADKKPADLDQSGATIHSKDGESIPCAKNERE